MRTATISAGFAGFLSGTANAAEIPYAVGVSPNEQLSGTVYLDDSSGDAQSADGVAYGVVNGKYMLDGNNSHSEITGTALKLTINFSRGAQRLSAHLDSCPVSPDNCAAGGLVILWEK